MEHPAAHEFEKISKGLKAAGDGFQVAADFMKLKDEEQLMVIAVFVFACILAAS